jgi:hypothetical protein
MRSEFATVDAGAAPGRILDQARFRQSPHGTHHPMDASITCFA